MNLSETRDSLKSPILARDHPDLPPEITLRFNAASLTFLDLPGQADENRLFLMLEMTSLDYYPRYPRIHRFI